MCSNVHQTLDVQEIIILKLFIKVLLAALFDESVEDTTTLLFCLLITWSVCCMLMLKMLSYGRHLVLWVFPVNITSMSFTLSLHWSISQSMHVLLKCTNGREREGTGNSAGQALVFIFHQLWWWYTVGS